MKYIGWLVLLVAPAAAIGDDSWPPEPMRTGGSARQLTGEGFLVVPKAVREQAGEEGVAPFVVAETPPVVRVAFHEDLGPDAARRRSRSACWGGSRRCMRSATGK